MKQQFIYWLQIRKHPLFLPTLFLLLGLLYAGGTTSHYHLEQVRRKLAIKKKKKKRSRKRIYRNFLAQRSSALHKLPLIDLLRTFSRRSYLSRLEVKEINQLLELLSKPKRWGISDPKKLITPGEKEAFYFKTLLGRKAIRPWQLKKLRLDKFSPLFIAAVFTTERVWDKWDKEAKRQINQSYQQLDFKEIAGSGNKMGKGYADAILNTLFYKEWYRLLSPPQLKGLLGFLSTPSSWSHQHKDGSPLLVPGDIIALQELLGYEKVSAEQVNEAFNYNHFHTLVQAAIFASKSCWEKLAEEDQKKLQEKIRGLSFKRPIAYFAALLLEALQGEWLAGQLSQKQVVQLIALFNNPTGWEKSYLSRKDQRLRFSFTTIKKIHKALGNLPKRHRKKALPLLKIASFTPVTAALIFSDEKNWSYLQPLQKRGLLNLASSLDINSFKALSANYTPLIHFLQFPPFAQHLIAKKKMEGLLKELTSVKNWITSEEPATLYFNEEEVLLLRKVLAQATKENITQGLHLEQIDLPSLIFLFGGQEELINKLSYQQQESLIKRIKASSLDQLVKEKQEVEAPIKLNKELIAAFIHQLPALKRVVNQLDWQGVDPPLLGLILYKPSLTSGHSDKEEGQLKEVTNRPGSSRKKKGGGLSLGEEGAQTGNSHQSSPLGLGLLGIGTTASLVGVEHLISQKKLKEKQKKRRGKGKRRERKTALSKKKTGGGATREGEVSKKN